MYPVEPCSLIILCDYFEGMSELSPAKRMAMASSMRHLQEMREKTLNMLKTDRLVLVTSSLSLSLNRIFPVGLLSTSVTIPN